MRIAIIGGGNVATHLYRAFSVSNECDMCLMVSSRTLEGLPEDADIYLIAVSDSAVSEVAGRIPLVEGIVAHTSGSVGIEAIGNRHCNKGVFYPLQTFSKDSVLDYADIPVFVEGSDGAVADILAKAASVFSDHVLEADSGLRRRLHVAAVFACNFTNRLFGIAEGIMGDAGLDFRLLLPLIRQSIAKLETISPAEAQTGPAVRGDLEVCRKHLEMLKSKPELCEIYGLLSDSIYKTRHKE